MSFHPLDRTTGESDFSPELGHRTVTAADLAIFGGLTGDYARMHFDHGLAATEPGAPGTIAHGLLTAAWALGSLAWSAPETLAAEDPDAAVTAFSVRFERAVRVGDRFSLRHRSSPTAAVDELASAPGLDTAFEMLNQRGERTGRGCVSVRKRDSIDAPPAFERPVWRRETGPRPLFAGDLLERGPRGESAGRTLSEADVVGFTNFTADRCSLYLNRDFAARGRFGERIVPPLLVFCLAFGDFLRDLLSAELPSTGLAGHLGDQFRCFAPVRVGDTLRTRHRPVRVTPSRQQPAMSIVHFGLQVLDSRDAVVQDGEVAMWIPARRTVAG